MNFTINTADASLDGLYQYVTYKLSCGLNVVTPPSDFSFTYTLGLSQTISPGIFTSSYSQCATYSYACQDQNGVNCMSTNSLVYPFLTSFSAATGKVTISFITFSVPSFELKISAISVAPTASVQITVNIYRPCLNTIITTDPIPEYQYKIRTNSTLFTFNNWNESYGSCKPFSYYITINGVKNNTNGFITFNPTLRQFNISATTGAAIGTYTIQLFGQLYQDKKTATVNFTIIIGPNNQGPPYFAADLAEVVLTVPESTTLTIPEIIDDDGDDYSITTNVASVNQFVSWKKPTFQIKGIAQKVGTFTVTITLTDHNETPLSQSYSLKITIKPQEATNQSSTTEEVGNTLVVTDSFFGFNVKEFNVGGKKIDRAKLIKKLNATISYVGMKGEVTIKFSNNLIEITDLDKISKYNALDVKLRPANEKSTNYIKSWEVKSFLNNLVKLQVNFQNPMVVSINAGTSMTGTMTANLALSVLMGLSLKQLWMLMNTLQIIVNLPLLQVSIPSNVLLLTQSLRDISNLNIIPPDTMKNFLDMLVKDDNKQQNGNLANNDIFQYSSQFHNSITPIVGLRILLKKSEKARKILDSIQRKIFFNAFLRALMKGYLNFAIAMLLSMQADQEGLISQFTSILMAFVIFLTPITCFFFLEKNKDKLRDPDFSSRFGTLYLNLRNSHISVIYTSLFFVRRLIFAFSITFLGSYTAFQMQLQVFLSFGLLWFLYNYNPIDSYSLLIVEMFNEIVLMSIAYLIIPFGMNHFDEETAETKYNLGWFIVAIVLGVILLNWINLVAFNVYMISQKVKQLLKNIRLQRAKKAQEDFANQGIFKEVGDKQLEPQQTQKSSPRRSIKPTYKSTLDLSITNMTGMDSTQNLNNISNQMDDFVDNSRHNNKFDYSLKRRSPNKGKRRGSLKKTHRKSMRPRFDSQNQPQLENFHQDQPEHFSYNL